jgi:hypothetical protein
MTVTSAFATITDSIAALSISGVTIKDINEIPQSANMLGSTLLPQPRDFVTDFKQTFRSFGSNGAAKIDFEYTLNYVYLHCPAGSGVASFDIYEGLMRNLSAILVAFASNDAITGLVDLQTSNIGNIGVIEDPSGNQFWGVLLPLRVLEYAQ